MSSREVRDPFRSLFQKIKPFLYRFGFQMKSIATDVINGDVVVQV